MAGGRRGVACHRTPRTCHPRPWRALGPDHRRGQRGRRRSGGGGRHRRRGAWLRRPGRIPDLAQQLTRPGLCVRDAVLEVAAAVLVRSPRRVPHHGAAPGVGDAEAAALGLGGVKPVAVVRALRVHVLHPGPVAGRGRRVQSIRVVWGNRRPGPPEVRMQCIRRGFKHTPAPLTHCTNHILAEGGRKSVAATVIQQGGGAVGEVWAWASARKMPYRPPGSGAQCGLHQSCPGCRTHGTGRPASSPPPFLLPRH